MKPLDLRCLPFMSFPSFTGAVIKVMSSLMMRRQERLEGLENKFYNLNARLQVAQQYNSQSVYYSGA